MIEDNLADVGLVREALEEHYVDGDLVVLSDGAAAISYIEALDAKHVDCPDLVIVDLNLPRKSGREVLQCISQNVKWRCPNVVVLSSSDTQKDRDDSISLGADRYIRKPLRLEEFLRLGAVFKSMLEDNEHSTC